MINAAFDATHTHTDCFLALAARGWEPTTIRTIRTVTKIAKRSMELPLDGGYGGDVIKFLNTSKLNRHPPCHIVLLANGPESMHVSDIVGPMCPFQGKGVRKRTNLSWITQWNELSRSSASSED